MKICCPFHVDGGDPNHPCAQDIPASHFDHAEMKARMLALQERVAMQEPRTTSMREEFALFYGAGSCKDGQ
jgi:hypothetical protein